MTASRQAVARASHLIDVRRWTEAQSVLARFLAEAPEDPEALCLLAQCRLELEDFAEAERAARAALRVIADDEWPHRLHSMALLGLNRPQEALSAASEAIRLAPQTWQPHIALVDALLRNKMIDAADRAATQALSLAPHESDAHLAASLVANARGDQHAERMGLKRALKLDPNNVRALNNLAVLDVNRGSLADGTRTLVGALRTDPQEQLLHGNLDAVGLRLLGRMITTMFLGTIVLVIVLAEETDGQIPPWWPRATTGAAILMTLPVIAWLTLRHVPARARRNMLGLPRRVKGQSRLVLVLFAAVSMLLLWIAFLPADTAAIVVPDHPGTLAAPLLVTALVTRLLASANRNADRG